MLRTVTFRLAFWHAGVFAALSLAAFALLYVTLRAELLSTIDADLREDVRESEQKLAAAPAREGEREFHDDVDPADVRKDARVLLDAHGRVRVTSDLAAWSGADLLPSPEAAPGPGATTMRTVWAPALDAHARVIAHRRADGGLMVIATSIADTEELLGTLRRMYSIAWAASVVVGLLLGWLLARRAMAGVDRVTATALSIGGAELGRRVPTGREGLEIEELARAFNGMLDRVDALVRELRDVSGNIAHDLKHPITRIRGLAETALGPAAGADGGEPAAATIVAECDHLSALIDTILEIAAADAGVPATAGSVVDLGAIARDAVDLFLPLAEDGGVRLELDLPASPLAVRADLGRAQRVVANLLDNAIKYTPRGGAVRVAGESADGQARLSISDTGAGIEAEAIPRIFERFHRGQASRSSPGHGLGLSLARAIVRAHGGDIDVASRPGEGSVFTIRWPAATVGPDRT